MPQAFNGAGDTLTPTKINFFCFWLLEIPLAYLLALRTGVGVTGVYWSIVIAEAAAAGAGMWLFRRGRWKTIQV
jgi:Na+-driven multidrug efflux pump